MSIRSTRVVAILLVFFISACSATTQEETAIPSTPLPPTGTLPATSSQSPTDVPSLSPLAATQTVVPVEGITSTQVNVRAEPSTASNVLGMIPSDTRVEITGKDPGESWWQINYPQGLDGKGWITAQYVKPVTTPQVPTIGGSQADPNSGSVAVIQQQLNVRSGPGTGFNSLGTLNPQDVVSLTGKDANGAWLQIDFTSGPEGKGWVNSAFVRAQGVESLPIITEAGLVVGTGTPTSIPATPTATLVPARIDNDSSSSPIASVVFEPAGTQTFIYNGELSTPDGDAEDWIAFRPFRPAVFVSLECKGNGSLAIEITENEALSKQEIACGNQDLQLAVTSSANYLIHLRAVPSAGRLQYTNYILTIKSRP